MVRKSDQYLLDCKQPQLTSLIRGVVGLFRRSGSVRERVRGERRGGGEVRERDASRAAMDRAVEPIATKPKGLKKILSKMRRSNSGHIPQEEKKTEDGLDKDQYR